MLILVLDFIDIDTTYLVVEYVRNIHPKNKQLIYLIYIKNTLIIEDVFWNKSSQLLVLFFQGRILIVFPTSLHYCLD